MKIEDKNRRSIALMTSSLSNFTLSLFLFRLGREEEASVLVTGGMGQPFDNGRQVGSNTRTSGGGRGRG